LAAAADNVATPWVFSQDLGFYPTLGYGVFHEDFGISGFFKFKLTETTFFPVVSTEMLINFK